MRKQLNTIIDADYKEILKKLSEKTKIPQSRLVDEALEDLFKKRGKKVEKYK